MPEGHSPDRPGGWSDQHAIVGDLLHLPGACAQGDDFANARLVDHLFIKFPDAREAFGCYVNAEQSSIGNRAGVRDREPAGSRSSGQHLRGAIPHEARAQLGESF